MSQSNQYAVYYTSETDGKAAGYVWNRVIWDGSDNWSAPSGSTAVLDSDGKYPIGSTYVA